MFSLTSSMLIFIYTGLIVISVFGPVAGLLSDVKWSRYRAVLYSSRVILIMLLVLSAVIVVMIPLARNKILHSVETSSLDTAVEFCSALD